MFTFTSRKTQNNKTMEETFKDLVFDLHLYGLIIDDANSVIIDKWGACQISFNKSFLSKYVFETLIKMNFSLIEFCDSTKFYNRQKDLTINFYNN